MSDSHSLIMVVNEDRFFLSHRKEVAVAALAEGWDVTILAKDTGRRAEVEQLGLHFVSLPVNPTGMNVFEEAKLLRFLLKYYRLHKDAIVHHVGLKNIVWGSLAARIVGMRGIVNAVSGLGTLYNGGEWSSIRKILNRIMAYGMNRDNVAVIFQNMDDAEEFAEAGITARSACFYIKGSGIDLNDFEFTPPPSDGKIRVVFTGRLLREKGVIDLLDAADLLKSRWHGKVEFLLCGELWANPKALQRVEIESRCEYPYIQWLGHRTDVKELLQSASVMAFPSYYREGLPKSVIEASAIGRPIVTTDSIGCRDTVEEGVNGFKVPPRNPEKLARALEHLFLHPSLRKDMGAASRSLACRDYDIHKVVDTHLQIYHSLYEASL